MREGEGCLGSAWLGIEMGPQWHSWRSSNQITSLRSPYRFWAHLEPPSTIAVGGRLAWGERRAHESGKPRNLLDLGFFSSKWEFGLWSGKVRSVQDGRQWAVGILQKMTLTLMSVLLQPGAWSLVNQALNHDFGHYSESWPLAWRLTVSMLLGLCLICLVGNL